MVSAPKRAGKRASRGRRGNNNRATGINCASCKGYLFRADKLPIDNDVLLVCQGCLRPTKPRPPSSPPVRYQAATSVHDEHLLDLERKQDWLGFCMCADGELLPVALAEDLGACWDALLAMPQRGALLAMPVEKVRRGYFTEGESG